MISFSFYVPDSSGVEVHEDRIDSPIKVKDNPLKNFKMKFLDSLESAKISALGGQNSSFSIVYNK